MFVYLSGLDSTVDSAHTPFSGNNPIMDETLESSLDSMEAATYIPDDHEPLIMEVYPDSETKEEQKNMVSILKCETKVPSEKKKSMNHHRGKIKMQYINDSNKRSKSKCGRLRTLKQKALEFYVITGSSVSMTIFDKHGKLTKVTTPGFPEELVIQPLAKKNFSTKKEGNISQTVSSKDLSLWIQQLPLKILQAKKRIEKSVLKTPLMFSSNLSSMGDNCKVYLKLENEQLTGSFKIRGAFNKMITLITQDRKVTQTGVITASSGNHGIACTTAGKTLGVPVHVFCRLDVDEGKRCSLQAMGAKITLVGKDCLDAENAARKYAKEHQIPYISPYNDEEIIAGQGTIGVEILEDQADIDFCLVPVGGGGLIAGIARYLKQMSPNIKVIGCQPEKSKVMYECVKANKIIFEESEETLSDGTSGGVERGSITLDLCRDFVDDWIMVSEEQIGKAIVFMLEKHHKVVEGAAGVALGAYMGNLTKFTKKKVAIVCCGANISAAGLRRLLNIYQ